jgi:hypothetical protein
MATKEASIIYVPSEFSFDSLHVPGRLVTLRTITVRAQFPGTYFMDTFKDSIVYNLNIKLTLFLKQEELIDKIFFFFEFLKENFLK